MNAQFAQAQEAFDNRHPPEYYEDPTALERAHDRALDDFIQDGYLCVGSPHQLGYAIAGKTRNYSAADAFKHEHTANLLTELLQADDTQRPAVANALAAACRQHARLWIERNVNEKYGAEK